MLSCRQLVNNLRSYQSEIGYMSGVGKNRDHINPTGSFSMTKVAAIPVGGALAVQARFKPWSDRTRSFYDVTIIFNGLEFVDQQDETHDFGIEVTPGKVMWCAKPSYASTPVQIGCFCQDYRHTFFWWDKRVNSYAGYDFPPYRRKTTTRGRRNLRGTPSLCKHALAMIKSLGQSGFVIP
jgi:hypothetical protein